jgi:hypothetical protein
MRGGTYMLTHVHLFVLSTVNRPYKLNIHTVLYCPPFCSVVLFMPPPQAQESILSLAKSIPGLYKRLQLWALNVNEKERDSPEPVFLNLLRSPGIDSQPGGIDSWAP